MADSITKLSPTDFEKYCLEILKAYAENENLTDFSIEHNYIAKGYDGDYQIDVYAEFTALECRFKVLCECKRYSHPIKRDIVATLHSKLNSIGAQKGILMSTSDFQSGAIQFAKEHGIALIQLNSKEHYFHSYSNGNEDSIHNNMNDFIDKYYPPISAQEIKDYYQETDIYPTPQMIQEMYNKKSLDALKQRRK